MLKIRAKWEGKCPRHPQYNPEKDPEGLLIKGGCANCRTLVDIWQRYGDFLEKVSAHETTLRANGGRVSFGVPAKYAAAKALK